MGFSGVLKKLARKATINKYVVCVCACVFLYPSQYSISVSTVRTFFKVLFFVVCSIHNFCILSLSLSLSLLLQSRPHHTSSPKLSSSGPPPPKQIPRKKLRLSKFFQKKTTSQKKIVKKICQESFKISN